MYHISKRESWKAENASRKIRIYGLRTKIQKKSDMKRKFFMVKIRNFFQGLNRNKKNMFLSPYWVQ